jgi:hypothetical protein
LSRRNRSGTVERTWKAPDRSLEPRLRLYILAFAIVSGGMACSQPAAEAPTADRASRDAAPGSSDAITVRYWITGCSVSDDFWRLRKSSTVTCDARGRSLSGTQGTLVWADYLEAEEIDTLVVEGESLETIRFELWWAADDSFTPTRSAAPVQSASATSSSRQVRFDLARAPEWQGRIRRFRLTWEGTPSPTTRVLSAWGTKRRVY